MLSVLAKSGAKLALATLMGATGFGLAATRHSDVSADKSAQKIEAAQPATALRGDAQIAVTGHARTDGQTPSGPTAARVAARVAAHAGPAVSGHVRDRVDSAPASGSTTEPVATPRSGRIHTAVHASANVGGSVPININGRVGVRSRSNRSVGLDLSLGI